jgi:hypothetical protein
LRCNIVIHSTESLVENIHNTTELYHIPECEVPLGSYARGYPHYALDAARITIHEFAWAFFDPSKKTLDKFEGTDAFRDTEDIIVYVMASVPPEEAEALVTALAEKFAVPETADAR